MRYVSIDEERLDDVIAALQQAREQRDLRRNLGSVKIVEHNGISGKYAIEVVACGTEIIGDDDTEYERVIARIEHAAMID